MTPIGSTNQNIKRLRRLVGRRSSRHEEGAFVIEGPTLVADAIAAGIAIEEIFVDADALDLLLDLGDHPFTVTVVQPGVLSSVLSSVTPQPICAVAPLIGTLDIADLAATAMASGRPILVLCGIGDPGNAGTLLRAAEASGCAGVAVIGAGVDVHNPKVVRASAGSVLRLPIALAPEAVAALSEFGARGIETVAAVARDGESHLDAELGGSVAIVMGNEAHGLSEAEVDACSRSVTIVMDGAAESLNVAMAATVLCFEALRRRHAG